MKVRMYPTLRTFGDSESGIRRVIEAYERYLPEFGVKVVDNDDETIDLVAIHAGAAMPYPLDVPMVSHLHGLYWTADYEAAAWEWRANSTVIHSMRYAQKITVPSEWVAETLRRDIRYDPEILPHGIEVDDWKHNFQHEGYVLWNKNRVGDVCDPTVIGYLAEAYPDVHFATTFAPRKMSGNIHVTGLLPHTRMKEIIQKAGVYLSSTKETFGIGILEALASGVPVLGYAHGGNLELVEHGVNGYLAKPKDIDDLIKGLEYCLKHRDVLSYNAFETVKKWNWRSVVEQLAGIYESTMVVEPPTVGIVIPTYNYADKVGDAIISAVKQDYDLVTKIVVVDDGSGDHTERVVKEIIEEYSTKKRKIIYHKQNNQGVANARNNGIELCDTKYVVCLDADDRIDPRFVEACVPSLEEDPSLGIAYTGLYYLKPNGEEGLSPWPRDFNFDKQLQKQNQIPTCCLFRKEMWRRLGGYRQRYAPLGAGSEDAEFWLRSGAYGWNAKKVTSAGLFLYSWMSGRVSGNKDYKEVDWTQYHPWVKDGKHPFASVATPKHISHPVRQYDEPVVSVVVPVGYGHESAVVDALDSLEAQTFRHWEAIVVWDSPNTEELDKLKTTYPYIRTVSLLFIERGFGAGYARNRGAEIARAPFLLFLDADDNLFPEAIEQMLLAWQSEQSIIYTDYVGKAMMSHENAQEAEDRGLLLDYDPKTSTAVLRHRSSDYDCEKAVRQPNENLYIWNLITSLVPRAWHDGIGGFDENMESWEDWDYWIRMARAGHCFFRISEPLVVYRFYSGNRRLSGLQIAENLLQYMLTKYEADGKVMPCNCGKRKSSSNLSRPTTVTKAMSSQTSSVADQDLVLVEYTSPQRGGHKVVGAKTGIVYGYRSGGDRFYVHRSDIALQPNKFRILEEIFKAPETNIETPPPHVLERAPTSAPERVVADEETPAHVIIPEVEEPARPLGLQSVPGITGQIEKELNSIGVSTLDELKALSSTQLMGVKGIAERRAETIRAFLASYGTEE